MTKISPNLILPRIKPQATLQEVVGGQIEAQRARHHAKMFVQKFSHGEYFCVYGNTAISFEAIVCIVPIMYGNQ